MTPLDEIVREQIKRDGPMRYSDVVELALYHPDHGFYTSGGRAGRRGDFLTSPEVGPLFGHVVANALDAEWQRLGAPQRFVVIDWGAGPGTLARSILAANPACAEALELVAVERSDAQRELHPEGITSVSELAEDAFRDDVGCVIANELLDNLAFTPIEFHDGAAMGALVDLDGDRLVVEYSEPHPTLGASTFSSTSRRCISQAAAADWLRGALSTLARGRVICFDYARLSSSDVGIRTFAQHGDAGNPLEELGHKDITVDVDLAQLQLLVKAADVVVSQSQWLDRNKINELVEEGRREWVTSAGTGSLAALLARSRVREAEALVDPTGLGGFTVAEWLI